MKTPSCSARVTKPWVQFILEEHLKQTKPDVDPKIMVKDFTIGTGANNGEGFNSELVKLDVTASVTEIHSESEPETAEYHFILKFMSTDPVSKVMNTRFKSSLKEYIIYKEYVNDLNTLQSTRTSNKYHINIPHLIYGKHTDSKHVLVMENLVSGGYSTNDKCKGLDGNHLREAVIQLARFHALSYAYCKTHDFLAEHPYFEVHPDTMKMVSTFLGPFIDNGITFLKLNKNEDLSKKLAASKERLISDFIALVHPDPAIPNCVIHGDYWNSNIMYKYNHSDESGEGNGSISSCKMIDWGNSTWGSPVLDLQYLINTSTTRDTRKDHLEATLRCYHDTYTDITTEVGTPVPNWTYEALHKEWKRLASYGFVMGLALSQGTLSKSNPVNKPKDPSVLDKSFCLPAKVIVDGMKLGMAKMSVPLMLTSRGQKLMAPLYKKMFRPVTEELLSGKNEILTNRVLTLIQEADDNGLFDNT